MRLSVPEPLGAHHETEAFGSGVESLDVWLKRRALSRCDRHSWAGGSCAFR